MAESFIFYADGSYLRLGGAENQPQEGKWTGCDVCQKPQPLDGGVMTDEMFTCAGCKGK
jgi:hypothetical protein